MLVLTACPQPGCAAPAEVVDRFPLASTDGPLYHARVQCVRRHWFLLPVWMLAGLEEPAGSGRRSRGDHDRG